MSETHNCPSKWPYFQDGGGITDTEEATAASSLFWVDVHRVEQATCSVEPRSAKPAASAEGQERDASDSCGKRKLEELSKDSLCNKASREKQRRGRLNDRFVALSQVLEPGRPPKADKASVLTDAVRVLGQLRAEAQQLQDGNRQLREQIKDLKAEKNELRDEKSRLKAEKERFEAQIKAMGAPPAGGLPAGFMAHHPALQAAAAMVAQAQLKPVASVPHFSPAAAMWQWMPPANLDTSQDHTLRPPVA